MVLEIGVPVASDDVLAAGFFARLPGPLEEQSLERVADWPGRSP